jgi:hypothetical protein
MIHQDGFPVMARVLKSTKNKVTVEVTVDISGSLLEAEQSIQDACNKVGKLSTQVALANFDTDGAAIMTGAIKWTSKGKVEQTYQTPYGAVRANRHVYQTSKGGQTWCPLEDNARIIRHATPRFAKQLTHKYALGNAAAVCGDLKENHGRQVTKSYVQNVINWVGSIAEAKEQEWDYELPKLNHAVSTIVLSMDGAHILMQEDGCSWREAMVGAASLYNSKGERQHTIYLGTAPEYGKGTFKQRFEKEIATLKSIYPDALYLGIADGAKDNWSFLEPHTDRQLLDFFHVTEYLAKVAYAAHPQKTGKPQREQWLSERCHSLKHNTGAAKSLIDEMTKLSQKKKLSNTVREDLGAALTYFKNHRELMDYSTHVEQQLPIGSGVTEAACKTLVKQRLCASGMRWKNSGAGIVLNLRALVQSNGRWSQFWDKINQFGAPCFA